MSTKLRVLYLHSNLRLGGAETLRLAQLRYLDRDVVEPHVAVHEIGATVGEQWLVSEIRALGIAVHDLGSARPLQALRGAYRLFREVRPHIVQTSMFEANTIGRLAALGSPGVRVIAEEHGQYGWKRRRHVVADHLLAHASDKIVACSDAVAQYAAAQARVPLSRFRTIHNCLDPARLVVTRSRQGVRASLGTPDDAVVVIGVGRVRAEKAFERAIAAFAAVRSRAKRELWIVGGDGGELEHVASRAAEASTREATIRVLGERQDVGDLLNAADVFAHTARWEGFGIVTLEAMASGLPVVAFANGGVPEVVDGSCARLVEEGDLRGFTRALEAFVADAEARARAGAAGRERVRQHFHPTVHVRRLLELYHDVLGEPWWQLA